MALYGDLTHDSRVRREAAALARAGYDVAIACLAGESGAPDLPDNVEVFVHRPSASSVVPGSPNPFFAPRAGRFYSLASRFAWFRAYIGNLRAWGRFVTSALGPVDIWHAHDLTGLAAIVPALDRDTPVVYDAHELFLETGTALRLPRPVRALLKLYERRLVARVSAVVTVNQALAKVLQRRYAPRRVEVVHNCPDRWSPPAVRPGLIRAAAGIAAEALIILYHGSLIGDRGIEQLMEAVLFPGLESAHVVLLGFGQNRDAYVDAAAKPKWRNRVHVLDAVAPTELLAWVASADVGAMPIQPSTLNLYLSTPNKLFECLAAGVPVVASDFPMMKAIVLDDPAGPLGAVCDPTSVDDVAAAIRSILELDPVAREAMRERCLLAARDRWNWQDESSTLTRLYDELTVRSPSIEGQSDA